MCRNVESGNLGKMTQPFGKLLAFLQKERVDFTNKGETDSYAQDRESRRLFGRSLRLCQVSAGGCNGCEAASSFCPPQSPRVSRGIFLPETLDHEIVHYTDSRTMPRFLRGLAWLHGALNRKVLA